MANHNPNTDTAVMPQHCWRGEAGVLSRGNVSLEQASTCSKASWFVVNRDDNARFSPGLESYTLTPSFRGPN